MCLTGAVLLQGGHKRAPPPRTLARAVRLLQKERLHLQHHSANWHVSPQVHGVNMQVGMQVEEPAGTHTDQGAGNQACMALPS